MGVDTLLFLTDLTGSTCLITGFTVKSVAVRCDTSSPTDRVGFGAEQCATTFDTGFTDWTYFPAATAVCAVILNICTYTIADLLTCWAGLLALLVSERCAASTGDGDVLARVIVWLTTSDTDAKEQTQPKKGVDESESHLMSAHLGVSCVLCISHRLCIHRSIGMCRLYMFCFVCICCCRYHSVHRLCWDRHIDPHNP